METADLMIEFGESSVELRDNLIDVIGQSLCESYGGGQDTNPENEFDNSALALVSILAELQDFAKEELTDIRNAFATDVMQISYQMGNTTDSTVVLANPAYYGAPTIALGFTLLIGIVLAWIEFDPPIYFSVQTWFIMPLFFILIFVSIIVIAIVGAVLVANSGEIYVLEKSR